MTDKYRQEMQVWCKTATQQQKDELIGCIDRKMAFVKEQSIKYADISEGMLEYKHLEEMKAILINKGD